MLNRPDDQSAVRHEPSSLLLTVIAIAAGALVANLYYAQPLVDIVGHDVGIRPDFAGAIVTLTQLGYGLGLLFIVSLADLVENRKLVLVTMGITTLALIGAAVSASAIPFLVTSLVIGLCSSGAQVLLPFAAHLVPEERRGRMVGNLMAGLLTGIMLSRPVALFVAGSFGWRVVFWGSAGLIFAIACALAWLMPQHKPSGGKHYGQILLSMAHLFRTMPVVRRRGTYQAIMFAAFNMFWTAAPILLARHFGLGAHGIALFALAGAGGAIAAPIAGRLADRGLSRPATLGAMAALGLAFYGTRWAADATTLVLLVVLAILIDAAVQVNQVVSQRMIYAVPSDIRGRVNALYMTTLFAGGALGSVLGTVTYHWGGWNATALCGGLMGVAMLMLYGWHGLRAKAARA